MEVSRQKSTIYVDINSTTGFDGTIIGSINSMKQYQEYFDLQGESSTKTGVVFVRRFPLQS